MNTTAELRKQVEAALAGRFPAALSVRPAAVPELFSCGVAELDVALGGGLPLGGITELTGPASSGRTTLALATLAEITRQGAACAYVDVADCFDPASAAALNVDLSRLLWVRTGGADSAATQNTVDAASPVSPPIQDKSGKSILDERKRVSPRSWRHPRHEAFGMDHAIGELFRRQSRPAEKLNANIKANQDCVRTPIEDVRNCTPCGSKSIRRKRPEPVTLTAKPWSRLDQALRATDLLLNAGGFRAIVLDMGDVHPEHARRVPLATWYRFRLQVEKSRTLFLLLTQAPCVNSCATVSLQFDQAEADWQRAVNNSPAVLTELRCSVNLVRNRAVEVYRKKPAAPAKASWSSATAWSR